MSSTSFLGNFILCNLVVAGAVCIPPTSAANETAIAEYLQCIRTEVECMDYDPKVLMGVNLCAGGHACNLDASKAGCPICSFIPPDRLIIQNLCPKLCRLCGHMNESLNTPVANVSNASNPQSAERGCTNLDSDASDNETTVGSPGLIASSCCVVVLIVCVSGVMKLRKVAARTIVTFAAVSLCMLLLAVGQALLSFDIRYNILQGERTVFRANFWAGIKRLWDNDNKFLSLVMVLFSGIWPFIKQIITFIAVVGFWNSPTELRVLKFLGLSGKLAFMDIGIVVAILATTPFDVDNKDIGVSGYLAASLRDGTFVIILGLILSRIITSTLIHASPPERVDAKPFSASAARIVRPCCAAISFAALCMVIAGSALPAVTVIQHLEMNLVPGRPSMVLTHQEHQYTIWALVDRCRAHRISTPFLTTVTVVVTLFFANVLGVLHSLTQMVVIFLGPFLRQRSASTRVRVAHSIQMMSEWASLDVLAIAILIAQRELPKMSETFSRNLGSCNGVKLETSIATETGLWLSLFGSLLTFASSPLIIKDCCTSDDDAVVEVPGEKEKDEFPVEIANA